MKLGPRMKTMPPEAAIPPSGLIPSWWRALEDLPGQQAVSAEWRQRLGASYDTLKGFLASTGTKAMSLPREDGREGPQLRVVPGTNGSPPVVIDDLLGTKRTGDLRECAIWRVQMSAVLRGLREGLHLPDIGMPGAGDGIRWDLGQIAVADHESVPVFLVVASEDDVLAETLRDIAMTSPDGAIVVLPTLRAVPSALKSSLESRRCQLIDASRSIYLGRDGRRLVMIGGPAELVSVQRRWRKLPTDTDCLYDIRRAGTDWLLVWNGHTMPLKHMDGLLYIRALIERRKQAPIHVLDLKAAVEGVDRGLLEAGEIQTMSAEAIAIEQTEKQRLLDLFERSQRTGNHDDGDRIMEQLEALEKRRAESVSITGKPRATSAAERARTSVYNLIRGTKSSALDAIRAAAARHPDHQADFEDLADHLQQSLVTGFMLAYRPRLELPWSL